MRANGKEYYKLYEVKRVNGEVETKYIGYLGKSPNSKNKRFDLSIHERSSMSSLE